MSDTLTFIQGDTGPNPVFHLRVSSPTAGATHRNLSSMASAFIRWQGVSSGAPAIIIPATVATGATAAYGFVEGLMGSAAGSALASGGRYELQVVVRGPWGVETWPRDEPFKVTIIDRNGSL